MQAVSEHFEHVNLDVAWFVYISVCVFVCVCVSVCASHDHKPCKNGWSDQDSDWDSHVLRETMKPLSE